MKMTVKRMTMSVFFFKCIFMSSQHFNVELFLSLFIVMKMTTAMEI